MRKASILKLKWFMPALMAAIMMAVIVPGTTEAGKKYRGSDPILMIDGHEFRVRFEWPAANDCDMNGPMVVRVGVPTNVDAELIAESTSHFSGCTQRTNTEIVPDERLDKRGIVRFLGIVRSDETFDVNLKVDFDGRWIREYDGFTNEVLTGRAVRLDAPNNGTTDPVLDGEYDLTYTYIDDDVYHLHDRGKRNSGKARDAVKKLLENRRSR